MARIRYVKPGFFVDEHIKDLPYEHRLFFQGLWCHADKVGRGLDRPERLKAEILPYDNVDPEEIMCVLAKHKKGLKRPFIIRYSVDDEKYYQVVNWDEHQRPHHTEKCSQIPPPPEDLLRKCSFKDYLTVTAPSYTAGEGEWKGKEKREVKKGKVTKEADYMAVVDVWNKTTLTSCAQLTDTRKEKLAILLENEHFRENYKEAISKLSNSGFAKGEGKKGWKVSFDWFISNDSNYVKAFEGQYDNKPVGFYDKL